jgi:HEAT repeat protein
LPTSGAPLRDWQAVAIGGGVINGLTQHGAWPRERIAEIIGSDAKLKERWDEAIELAKAMADDKNVRAGTRYDALRMLGVLPWDKSGDQLKRYLTDPNEELQMGAVSAIGDIRSAQATATLVASLPSLAGRNRAIATEALLRDPDRATALLAAVKAGKVSKSLINDDQRKRLLEHSDDAVRRGAADALIAK